MRVLLWKTLFLCRIWRQFSGLILATQRPKVKPSPPSIAIQGTVEGKYFCLSFFSPSITWCHFHLLWAIPGFLNVRWLVKTLATLVPWFWWLSCCFCCHLGIIFFAGPFGRESIRPCLACLCVCLYMCFFFRNFFLEQNVPSWQKANSATTGVAVDVV